MKGRKVVLCGIVIIIILLNSTVLINNVSSNMISQEAEVSEGDNIEKPYIVTIISPSKINTTDDRITFRLSQNELNDLVEEISKSNYSENISIYDIIDDKLDAFRKYGMLPEQLTTDNILSCIKNIKSQPLGKPSYIIPHLNVGPHLYILFTPLFKNAAIPSYFMHVHQGQFKLIDLINLINITEFNITQFEDIFNDTYLETRMETIPLQIMITAPTTLYASVGLYGIPTSSSIISRSFIGIYFMKLVGLGIYIL